jgi:hypothetical protein
MHPREEDPRSGQKVARERMAVREGGTRTQGSALCAILFPFFKPGPSRTELTSLPASPAAH